MAYSGYSAPVPAEKTCPKSMAAALPATAGEWTRTFDITGRPAVRINTNDGGVQVLTSKSYKQIAVRVEYHGYEPDQDFTIDSRQTGNRVEVSARLRERWCVFCSTRQRSFRIEVRIPIDADLEVDTGDGAALCFFGDPEDALFAAAHLGEAMRADESPGGRVRIGINARSCCANPRHAGWEQ